MIPRVYEAVALDSQPTSVEASPVKRNKKHQYSLLPNEWKLMIIIYFGVLIGAVSFNLIIVFPTNLSSVIATFVADIIPSNYPAIRDLFFFAILLGLSVKSSHFILFLIFENNKSLC